MECKNKFLNSLKNKKEFAILFIEKDDFDKNRIDEFNKKLKKFIELQKNDDEIDLSFVCFHEHYDFTDKNSNLRKILQDLEVLKIKYLYDIQYEKVTCKYLTNKEYYYATYDNSIAKVCENQSDESCCLEKKEHCFITKKINFGNAIFFKVIEFIRVHFEKKVSFEGVKFKDNVNFERAVFEDEAVFEGIICEMESIFKATEFQGKTGFYRARFYGYSSFKDAIFYDEVDFENTISKDIFFFHNVRLGKINLIGSYLENANFLRLKDKDKKILQKDNFQNKDSVRLVKAQYEKENNTTEVNWSFPLEQEFYLDLLSKDKSYYPSKNINKISLLIHKYVSNYGTDWVRALIILFAFGFIASLGYSFLSHCPNWINKLHLCKEPYFIIFKTEEQLIILLEFFYILTIYFYYEHIKKYEDFYGFEGLLFILIIAYCYLIYLNFDINNQVITLINPLNIFNQDMVYIEKDGVYKNINYFEDIAIYGVIVKVITISLMYQFIISFRNSTRRK